MSPKPLHILTIATTLAVCGCTRESARPPAPLAPAVQVTADLAVQELAPGVWRHISWARLSSGARFPSNGLLVRRGDHVLLVDSAWGEAPTAALLDWVATHLKLPVTQAVATHAHDDRVGGAAVLAARGIPFFASPLTRERAGVASIRALPGLERAGDAFIFEGIEVFYPGPGHSADNVVVWVPDARILFGGCAVKSAASHDLGNVAEANIAEWPASLRRLEARYPSPQAVVPGHGERGDIARTLELLAAPR